MDSLIRKIARLLSRKKVPKTGTDSSTCTFGNHLILDHIFLFLDLDSLKVARLVCSTWAAEGLKRLRDYGITIHLQPPFTNAVEDLKRIVSSGQIRHTLMLSFQIPSWELCRTPLRTDEEQLAAQFAYYGPRHSSSDGTILELLQTTGEFVYELRLEMNLMDMRDAEVLTKILASMPHLGKCSLDFPNFERMGLISISKGLFPPSVHTLGLRLDMGPIIGGQVRRELLLGGTTHLMRICSSSNIQFLDLDGWTQAWGPNEAGFGLWLKAIRLVVEEDPNAFPKLSGLRKTVCSEEECKHWVDLPISLSRLYLFCYQWPFDDGVGKLENVLHILKRHAKTLITLDFNWISDPAVEFQTPIHLPRFPNLTTLEYTSMRGRLTWNGWTLEMLDALNLRSIFLGGPQALRRLLPSLTTLSVLLFHELGDEIWEFIFPDTDVQGNALEFDQIKFINLSFVGSCGYPKLTRFYSIFPSLTKLRHLKWEKVRRPTDSTPIRFAPDVYGKWEDWDSRAPEAAVACEHCSTRRGQPLGSTFPETTTTKTWGWPLAPLEGISISAYDFPLRYLLRSPMSDPCLWY